MNSVIRNTLVLLIIAFALPLHVHARLGESEAELVTRFGKPTTRHEEKLYAQGKMVEFGTILQFRQDDWSMTCSMVNGRCAKIAYSKPGEWTEEQIQTVLGRNQQGMTWTEVSKPSVKKIKREWNRSDSATALWFTGSMTLVTPAYEQAKKQVQDKAKEQSKGIPRI